MEKGKGEAYFENGQKEGEANDELVDIYYMEPSQLSTCSFLAKRNVRKKYKRGKHHQQLQERPGVRLWKDEHIS